MAGEAGRAAPLPRAPPNPPAGAAGVAGVAAGAPGFSCAISGSDTGPASRANVMPTLKKLGIFTIVLSFSSFLELQLGLLRKLIDFHLAVPESCFVSASEDF
jgi:hypothetical protein